MAMQHVVSALMFLAAIAHGPTFAAALDIDTAELRLGAPRRGVISVDRARQRHGGGGEEGRRWRPALLTPASRPSLPSRLGGRIPALTPLMARHRRLGVSGPEARRVCRVPRLRPDSEDRRAPACRDAGAHCGVSTRAHEMPALPAGAPPGHRCHHGRHPGPGCQRGRAHRRLAEPGDSHARPCCSCGALCARLGGHGCCSTLHGEVLS